MSEIRVGVFICGCGGHIAGALDLDALAREVAGAEHVARVERLPYGCSPDGLDAIRAAITADNLDRVLVAGCTPRLMALRLQRACAAAGIDPGLVELADIREGCAWVHPGQREEAMRHAAAIIRMGVARLAARRPRQSAKGEVVPAALVIGGGLAGITAAVTLARAGVPITLVEREAALGGVLRLAHTLPPDGRCAAGFLAGKIAALQRQPNARVLLRSRVARVDGTAGRYSVQVTGPGGETATVEAGAIIVATGAQVLRPTGQFRYDGRRVLTQLEFEAELRSRGHGAEHASAGSPAAKALQAVRDVVMILCAGQRGGSVPYCSQTCCATALKQALEVRAAEAKARVTILCRDLRQAEGDGVAEAVQQAARAGVKFVRYDPSTPPIVTDEAVIVRGQGSRDTLRLAYDRVVLATPLVPQADAGQVARLLGLAQDAYGFFAQPRLRLRPGEVAERGIFVCGCAHAPTGWAGAEFQAMSTAFRALHYLRAGRVDARAGAAAVDEALCTGCGTCASACPFGAITMAGRDGVLSVSRIDPLRCTGCGNCVVACPVKAIAVPVDADQALLAQIEAALQEEPSAGGPRILVLGCEWSGHAAAELAGARHLAFPPGVRLIRTGCSARFDPMHVLWALASGADGVFLGACPPGQCHYQGGNRHAQARMETLRSLLAAGGVDPRRLRFEWISPDDAQGFVAKITAFAELLAALKAAPAPEQRATVAAMAVGGE